MRSVPSPTPAWTRGLNLFAVRSIRCSLPPDPRPLVPLASLRSSENRLVISGAACCLVSALAYTGSNICMRQLTILQCDPVWAVFNRELVATVVVGVWLLCQAIRGRPTLPSGRTLLRLLLVGLLIEVVGNVGVQWALGVVGLAVTVPAEFGMMIAGGAVMGYVWLGEQVSIRSIVAIALLLVALVLLGMGVEAAGKAIAASDMVSPHPLMLALGVAACGLAGCVFAVLNITIRHSVTRTTLPTAVAFLVPLMGVVSLGPLSVCRLGWQPLWDTSGGQFALMGAAGAFNLIGFMAFIYGLQRTTVVHANVVNASQVAMAAVAGMAVFHEPPNLWLVLGIVLSIAGILGFDHPTDGGVP
jgi:drug/metabolite transporter, DME family